MFRSGSTLVEQILSSHSAVTSLGENNFFKDQTKNNNEFYPENLENKKAEYFRHLQAEYQKEVLAFKPNTNIFTDKRPDNIWNIGLIKAVFPHAKIIITSRNELDNQLSIFFQQLESELAYATNFKNIEHFSQQQNELISHWKSLFLNDIHEVNYDELVKAPDKVISELLSFAQLEWQEDCLAFEKSTNRVKTASIWQVRKPLYKTSSGKWKNYQKFYENIK